MIRLESKFTKGLSVFLAVALMFTMLPGGLKAMASGIHKLNIDYGDITFASDYCYYYASSGDSGASKISSSEFSSSIFEIIGLDQTSHTITVVNSSVNIQLDAVNISSSTAAPIRIENGGNVNLSLCGDNYLTNTSTSGGGSYAGLSVERGGSMTISDAYSGDSLTATGGLNSAGIGQSYALIPLNYGTGKITIKSGKICAYGKGDASSEYGGAGIGTCGKSGGENGGATISITGGTVVAVGGTGGAGIGDGGYCTGNSSVSISGGSVTANGGSCGTGIGNGVYATYCTVSISGGSVKAKGGDLAKDIGDGYKSCLSQIYINGGSVDADSVSSPCVSSTDSRKVYKTTMTLPGGTNTRVDALDIRQGGMSGTSYSYGGANPNQRTWNMNMTVDSNDGNSRKLYLWLPQDSDTCLSFTLGGNAANESYTNFHGTVGTENSNLLKLDQTPLTISGLQDSYTVPASVSASVTGGTTGSAVTALYSGRDGTSYGSNQTAPAAVGKYTFTATMPGNETYYDAVATKDFEVDPNTSILQIAAIPDQAYTSSKITPDLTVTANGNTLSNNKDYTVSFSDNTDVGTANVVVTGINSYAGYTASATFHIVASLQSITIGGGNLEEGKSEDLTATGHYSDNSTKDLTNSVTWSLDSGSGIASINSSTGALTSNGTGTGNVTVRATAKDGSGVYGLFTVYVTSNESISISSTNGNSVFAGDNLPLTATVTGGGASPTVTWAIDNDAGLAQPIGMSKGAGTITDNKDGTATFNATTAGYVYVKASADGVSSKPYLIYIYAKGTSETEKVTVSGSNSVATGGAIQLNASATIGDSTLNVSQSVNWSSSDDTIATVDSSGKVTGVKAGTATITATAADGSGVSSSADITVTEAGTAPTITTSSLSNGTVGTTYSQTLAAIGDTPITWSVQSGSLPDGLNLDPSTGTISGTPTKDGDFTFTVQAANDLENDTKELSIHIETAASGNTYGIRLTPSLTGTFTFDPQTEGYDNSSVSGLMVGVWNTGNQPTGDLTAALSGTGKDFFTLSLSAVGSIDVGRMNGFTVAPKTGLSAGTYTATLTVSGGSVAPQSFDVSFTVTAALISSEKAITAFSIGGYAGTIDESKHAVAVTVPGSADVTKLAPTVTVSEKAEVFPASGAVQDFTKPVIYTVTAQDKTTQDYTVTVTPDQTLACGIGLSQTGKYIFPTQAAGYSPVFPLDVTVRNTGNQPTGALSVTLSGVGKDSFGVYPSPIDSINAGGSARFSLTPNLSLPQGVYTATVTVSGVNVTPQSFEVSFTVNDGSGSDYTIGLSQTGQQPYTFASQTAGYGGLTPLNVTVTSTGAKATGDLSIVLGGLNSNSFTLSKTAIGSISPGGTDSFAVVPNTGLPAGTYVATVAVFGDNVTSHFFTVVFTVNSNDGSGGNGGSGSGGGDSGSTSYQATARGSDGSSATLSVTTSGSSAEVTVGTAQDSLVTSGGTLAITIPDVTGATSYDLKLPASDLSANAGGTLAINTELGSISLPSNMLSSTASATDKTARITISEGDSSSLPDSVKAAIGDRPVIQLTLSLGGTQSEWNNPDATVTVSIPYTPTAAEKANPDSIVVWYIDGSGSAVCVPNGHYDASTGTVTFKTTHFSQYAVGYNAVSFSDVTDGAWYKDFVNYLSARNIVGGTGNSRFSPEANITRAQFVTILARMSGESLSGDTSSAFSDVSQVDWCFAAVQWASKNGIAAGSDGKFDPNADITREEMAVMLYRYAKYAGIDVSSTEETSIHEFPDYDSISNWALTPVQWAVSNNIASGNGSGSFAPQASATRAEAAKMAAALAQRLATE